MQPYPNPNYYTQYQQPQYNPYMQRMENLQQFQQAINQPLQPTQLSVSNQTFTPLGKIVESIDIVKATDIPMDGNMYYFPKADGSEVYSKNWLPNGTTQILTFKPFFEDKSNDSVPYAENFKIGLSDEVTQVFTDMLNQINGRLDILESSLPKNIAKSRAKKEVLEDE